MKVKLIPNVNGNYHNIGLTKTMNVFNPFILGTVNTAYQESRKKAANTEDKCCLNLPDTTDM